MIDAHAVYDAVGSTDTVVAENNSNAVIPSADGATTIGVSPFSGAVLCAFGAHVAAVAGAIVSIGLSGNNIVDPTNKILQTDGSVDNDLLAGFFGQFAYSNGPNLVNYAQEAAGKLLTYKLDYVRTGRFPNIMGTEVPITDVNGVQGMAVYSTNFAALTAGAYGTKTLSPVNVPPIGTYAILGAKVSSLTSVGMVRFQHTDFGGAFPGFPIMDLVTGTLTQANYGSTAWVESRWQGAQFVYLSQILGTPCCPVFAVQGQGTGLVLQAISTNGDTPVVTLNLLKVG